MKRLKFLRKQRKLTQVEMARILNIAQSTYAQYETGKSNPDYNILVKIANFFEVSVDYLLGNDFINDAESTYNFEKTKQMIVEELGPDVEIHFKDWKKVTREKLRVIKAVIDMENEDSD